MLNALQVFKLAVSLGGTESLVSTRLPPPIRACRGDARPAWRLDATIRVSIGIEHPDDLVADLAQALSTLG